MFVSFTLYPRSFPPVISLLFDTCVHVAMAEVGEVMVILSLVGLPTGSKETV